MDTSQIKSKAIEYIKWRVSAVKLGLQTQYMIHGPKMFFITLSIKGAHIVRHYSEAEQNNDASSQIFTKAPTLFCLARNQLWLRGQDFHMWHKRRTSGCGCAQRYSSEVSTHEGEWGEINENPCIREGLWALNSSEYLATSKKWEGERELQIRNGSNREAEQFRNRVRKTIWIP